MNEDKILRQNKIPGCERLTRPEEIAALSKYLKKIKQTYDEHTELEEGKLEIPGKTTGQLVEITELSTESIKLKGKKDIGLEEELVKLEGRKDVELEDGIITLKDKNNISGLSEEKIGLEDKRETELSTELIGLKDKKTTRLSDYREDISDYQDINLEDEKETISPDDINKLSDYKESFTDDRKTELEDERINIDPENVSSLSEYIEKITDSRKTELETKSAKLEVDEKIELENNSTKLKVDEKVELETESSKLKTNKDVSDLSDYKENISDKRKAILDDKKEGLEVNENIELADGIITLDDKRKVELEKGYEGLEDKRKIELEKNKEGLEDRRKTELTNKKENLIDPRETELNNKKESLFDLRKEPELSTHREDFIDDREVELVDKKENISDEREVNLSEYKDSFSDIRDVNLEDKRIDISPEDIDNLSDFRDNFTDDRDTSLEDEVVNINKTSDLPLSDFIDELTNGDFKEVDLEDTVIKTPGNSDEDAGNNHSFINPKDAVLEDGIITIVSNNDSDAGDGHNFMNPSNAELEDEVIPLAPEDPHDNAGNNHNFIDPNNATLSDKILDLAPEDPFDDAGNEHDFIDPNNAHLEDETIYIPANDPESNAGGEHNFMNPDNAQLEDEVVNRPEVSSEDARYTGGGYDYISDTTDYIEQEKIDEHRKKILRPNASELDARIEDLYKYKDNLTDPELYEKVIDLLESIGNDHEYDNLDSTTENFHRMTGIVGSTSWVQKLEALVSAYLSSSTITPQNAHRFENALYSSFIPETRLDNEYNFIDNYAGTHYEEEKTRINETRDKITRPANDPDDNARETDYNYWDKEDSTSELIYTNTNSIKRPVNNPFDDARNDIGNYNYLNKENLTEEELGEYSKQTKIPVEGLDTGGGLFGYGPQSAAEKFKERDKENYDINQARVGVPDYVLSDLLVDSIQNGTYTNFNLGNTDSYLNLLRDITHSDISISRYLRWAAEKACKLNPGGSTTRKILLEETLAALVFARDYVERVTKSNRDRLPGDENWYSSLINGGIGEFVREGVEAGRQWIMGRARNSELPVLPEKDDPLNRPNVTKSEVIDGRPIESDVYQVTGVRSNIGVNFARDYTGGLGLRTTLDDLCKSETPSTLSDLKEALKTAPYITTPGKFGSFDGGKYKSYSLDSNAYWEVVLEPLCYGPLNGGISFLPSIQEINVMNKLQHGVSTAYNGWIPFTSFDLQKSKMIGKSLSLFDGEINYPSSVELTNELRLTIVDDEFKSWRQYFQKCMDVSVYNSTSHKGHFYGKTKNELLKNIKELTIVDKDNICIAFYKNIAFNIRIYLMNPQYSTVKSYNLLCVLKDFSEEYSGDTDGAAQDLNLVFSIVGELDYNIPNNGYVEELDSLPATTINSGFNFPDIIQPRDFSIPNDPDIISPEDWETLGLVGRFGPG